jgi:hypothetical protein
MPESFDVTFGEASSWVAIPNSGQQGDAEELGSEAEEFVSQFCSFHPLLCRLPASHVSWPYRAEDGL